MPAAIKPSSAARDATPAIILQLLDALSLSPIATSIPAAGEALAPYAEPVLRSIRKPIAELLGRVFTPTAKGTGLPKRLNLSQWNARTGNVEFHGEGPTRVGVERFEASPGQLDKLIRGGALDMDQPPPAAVEAVRRRIASALDADQPVVPVRPSAQTASEPGYVYHATNAERAREIANSQLRTHRPSAFTDQSTWPDLSTERRAYFTPKAGSAHSFAPEEGESVLLRLKQDAAPLRTESGTGDVYSQKSIAAKLLELLTETGWAPLERFRK